MALTENQRKHLRGLGHELHPVVTTGAAGVTPGVLAELEEALAHHELLKVKVRAGTREDRDAMIGELCERTGAELVQRVGHVALLWRANPDKRRVSLPGR
ncbi:MAG: ribosome assembly RNA-binding protein YhbY [Gammaproteobacteria bacterium]